MTKEYKVEDRFRYRFWLPDGKIILYPKTSFSSPMDANAIPMQCTGLKDRR